MTMMLEDLFKAYEALAARADRAFSEINKEYESRVKCGIHCSDCCHSVFGLFLIESVYINYHFNKLDGKLRREAALRGDKSDQDLQELKEKLRIYKDDPEKQALAMARERVGCPLLNDEQKCMLYAHRPITCRVYGIPAVVNGKPRVCWKSGFEKGRSYPAFDLDGMYRELYRLSGKLLEKAGQKDVERAS
ncbi:MAG: YkgJ family cysteine cluster protein, partial [Firmicutes bacterium]|nr:YkgJ family cysteine cluster protein [Bacillota bacterium]